MQAWLGAIVLVAIELSWLTSSASAATPVDQLVDARAILTRFMDARIGRRDAVRLSLMTERLRGAPPASVGSTGQISNPCWYRYAVVAYDARSAGISTATVRIYQQFWPGDVIAGPPDSWLQVVRLVQFGS